MHQKYDQRKIISQHEPMTEKMYQPVEHRLCVLCLACRWRRRSFFFERILFSIIIISVTSQTLDQYITHYNTAAFSKKLRHLFTNSITTQLPILQNCNGINQRFFKLEQQINLQHEHIQTSASYKHTSYFYYFYVNFIDFRIQIRINACF